MNVPFSFVFCIRLSGIGCGGEGHVGPGAVTVSEREKKRLWWGGDIEGGNKIGKRQSRITAPSHSQ